MEQEKKIRKMAFVSWLKQTPEKVDQMGISMGLKLFLLLTMLVISIIFAVLVILTLTGTLTAGVKNTQNDMTKELSHISEEISSQYGQFSAHTIVFSKELSSNIENDLTNQGLTVEDLKRNPELLESVIRSQYKKSLFALQRAGSSGVFMILDATVNPALENSEHSKAGLYIKNMEPNILNSSSSYLLILRGSSQIGRENSVTLHSQWRMEFNVKGASYYYAPMNAAKNKKLPLSRLYHWSTALTLPGTAEEVMLCSAPLIDSKGNVFGVCGFEVSAMLFKLSHMPDSSTYQRVFCILAPAYQDKLNTSQAFMAGGYSIRSITNQDQTLTIRGNQPFSSYRQEDGTLYSGLHQYVNLYPKGSPFQDDKWMIALLMPDKDISASVIKRNLKLLLLFFLLLILGIATSYYLSKRFLMPFAKGIEAIKLNDYSSLHKTNIVEIDDLIEFLSSSQAITNGASVSEKSAKGKLPSAVFDEFVNNTKLLSPAERAVFNLYVEGYTAKDITQILCLSINTIKTHNKRIYIKLNVSSREELLVYVNMLKEAGREIK